MVRSYRDSASTTSASSRPPPPDRDLPSEAGDYRPRSPSPPPPPSPVPPPRPRPRRRPLTPEASSSPPVPARRPAPPPASPSAGPAPPCPRPAAPPSPAGAPPPTPDDFVDVTPPVSDFEVAENGRLVSREEIAQQLLRVCVEGRELTVLLGHASAEWWNSPATRAQRAFVRAQLAAAGKGAFRVAKTALIGDGGGRDGAREAGDDGRAAREAEERHASLLGHYARGAVRGLTGGVFGGVAAQGAASAPAAASSRQSRGDGAGGFEDDDDFDMGMFDVGDDVEDGYGNDIQEPRSEAAQAAPAAAWGADEDEDEALGLPFGENEEW